MGKGLIAAIVAGGIALTFGTGFLIYHTTARATGEYVAESQFYWSSDGGSTYGNGTKEYEVGPNVYMQLIVGVKNPSIFKKEVNISLEIPYIQDVESKYMDGQIITPRVDELNNITSYDFVVTANRKATEQNFIFRFVPIKATDITIKLTFDNTVKEKYDRQNSITFVNQAPED